MKRAWGQRVPSRAQKTAAVSLAATQLCLRFKKLVIYRAHGLGVVVRGSPVFGSDILDI